MSNSLLRRLGCILAGALLAGGLLACPSTGVAGTHVVWDGSSAINKRILVSEEDGKRILQFEERGARQTVVRLGRPDLLQLNYSRVLMTALAFVPKPRSVLVVGLGGGAIPMFLRHHFPGARIDSVEIDPAVVMVAKKYFGFEEDENNKAWVGDGRLFIEKAELKWDIIILDAYGKDYIPPPLTTLEFLRAVIARLNPSGICVANVWSRRYNRLYESMLATYQQAFPELHIVAEPDGSELFFALPAEAGHARVDIVLRASDMARNLGFPFELGRKIDEGYKNGSAEKTSAKVLRDR